MKQRTKVDSTMKYISLHFKQSYNYKKYSPNTVSPGNGKGREGRVKCYTVINGKAQPIRQSLQVGSTLWKILRKKNNLYFKLQQRASKLILLSTPPGSDSPIRSSNSESPFPRPPTALHRRPLPPPPPLCCPCQGPPAQNLTLSPTVREPSHYLPRGRELGPKCAAGGERKVLYAAKKEVKMNQIMVILMQGTHPILSLA